MVKKARVELEVLLKSAGIEATTAQVKKLQKELKGLAIEKSKTAAATKKQAKELENLTKEQNKAVRAHKGVAEATGRQGKDFSRMAQGMGGLVQVYATIIGNVYALSTAFLVLRNAADLSSMMKSAEDFSNRFGRSVTTITRDIQKATGGALSFAEALPNINKAIAGGFNTEKITQLAQAATLASQTFGGTANEALGRFISAAQRGRTEIVQTLGIVIQTEKVYERYAASIGKAKDELNAFDKQQAITNAIIEESQNVFDGVKIDPNPFTQFANTLADVKDSILTTITDFLTPLFNLFNKSGAVAVGFIIAIAGMIARKLLPAVKDLTTAAIIAGRESSQEAIKTAAKAKDRLRKLELERSKTSRIFSAKDAAELEKNFKNSLDKQEKIHASFKKTIIKQNGEINTAVLTEQRAALKRQENALIKGKGIQKGLPTNLVEIRKQRIALDQVAASIEKGNIAQAKALASQKEVTKATRRYFAVASSGYASYSATITGFQSQFKSGFGRIFNLAQNNLTKASSNMIKTWRLLGTSIQSENVSMAKSFKRFGSAIGKTLGVGAGAFIKLANHLTLIMFVLTAAIAIWNRYGDSIRGISPDLRKFIDIQKELPERLTEIRDRTNEYLENLEGKTPQTLKELGSALDFTTGSFMSINEELNKFTASFKQALGSDSIEEAKGRILGLKNELEALREEAANQGTVIKPLPKFGEDREEDEDQVRLKRIAELKTEIRSIDKAINKLGKSANTEVITQAFASVTEQAKTAGINIAFIETTVRESLGSIPGITDEVRDSLASALAAGDEEGAKRIFEEATKSAGIFGRVAPEAMEAFAKAVGLSSGKLGSLAGDLNSNVKAVRELDVETAKFFDTFEQSLFAKTGGNKEFGKLSLNIRNTIESLAESAKESDLAGEIVGDEKELNSIKQFLGFSEKTQLTIGDLQERSKNLTSEILAIESDGIRLEREKANIKQAQITVENRIARSFEEQSDKLALSQKLILLNLKNEQQFLEVKKREAIIQKGIIESAIASGASGAELELLEAQLEAQESLLDLLDAETETIEENRKSTKRRQEVEREINNILQARAAIDRAIGLNQANLTLAKEKLIRSDKDELDNLRDKQNFELVALNLSKVRRQNKIDELEANGKLTVQQQLEADVQKALLKADQQRIDSLEERAPIEEKLLRFKQLEKDASAEQAVFQAQLKEVQDRVATSIGEAVNNLEEEQILQREIANQEHLKLAIKRAQILADGIQTDEQQRQLNVINAQLIASEQLLENQKERQAIALANKPLELANEILAAQKEVLQTEEKLLQLRQQNTRNARVFIKLKRLEIRANIDALENQKEQLENQIEITNNLKMQTEIKIAQIKKLELEKQIIEEQTKELERQDHLRQLRERELAGDLTIFSKEGIDKTVDLFIDEFNNRTKDLKSTFEQLAIGFADALESAFDTAVDNLLEGGENFGFAVREALKASLREAFGEALKARIKDNISIILDQIKKQRDRATIGAAIEKGDTKAAEKLQKQIADREELQKQLKELETIQGNLNNQDNANAMILEHLPRLTDIDAKFVTANQTLTKMSAQLDKLIIATSSCCGGDGATRFAAAATGDLFGGAPTGAAGSGSGLVTTVNQDELTNGVNQLIAISQKNLGIVSNPDPTALDSGTIGKIGETPGTVEGLDVLGNLMQVATADSKSAIIQALFAIAAQIIASNQASGGGSWLTALFGGADGGIMSGRTSKITPMATGGMVTGPSLALLGEGKNAEAVVPLPNNREIPVEMKGGGETININMEQNFDFTNAGPDTVAQLRAEARMIEERTFNRVFGEINKGGKYAKMVGRR